MTTGDHFDFPAVHVLPQPFTQPWLPKNLLNLNSVSLNMVSVLQDSFAVAGIKAATLGAAGFTGVSPIASAGLNLAAFTNTPAIKVSGAMRSLIATAGLPQGLMRNAGSSLLPILSSANLLDQIRPQHSGVSSLMTTSFTDVLATTPALNVTFTNLARKLQQALDEEDLNSDAAKVLDRITADDPGLGKAVAETADQLQRDTGLSSLALSLALFMLILLFTVAPEALNGKLTIADFTAPGAFLLGEARTRLDKRREQKGSAKNPLQKNGPRRRRHRRKHS